MNVVLVEFHLNCGSSGIRAFYLKVSTDLYWDLTYLHSKFAKSAVLIGLSIHKPKFELFGCRFMCANSTF